MNGFIKEAKRVAEFAPGIPASREISSINIPKGFTRLVVQKHSAKRAGDHLDLRIQSGSKAYSWALRDWPKKHGEQVFARRVEDHSSQYLDFQGVIPEGYGAGTVSQFINETIDIIYANDDKIKFVIPNIGEFAIIHTSDLDWLLVKMNKVVGPISSKEDYKEQLIKSIDINDGSTVLQPKIDGAHSIITLAPGKMNRVFSYRISAKTGDPVEHTHQMKNIRDAKVPPGLGGTVLRAEVFARKNGRALPPQNVSGLLNSGIIKSRTEQEESSTTLVPVLFDITKYRGHDVTQKPYEERLDLLKQISKQVKVLEMPDLAYTPKEKKSLIQRIRSGRHPDTSEGVIAWNLQEPVTTKSKLKKEFDVYIKKITKGLRGFSYSIKPHDGTAGRVGTGFSTSEYNNMQKHPEKYIGNVARVIAQQQFPSGALRGPSYQTMHVEKNIK